MRHGWNVETARATWQTALTPSMTDWIEDHPGGPEIILSNKSKDVTPIFNPRHPSDQLEPQNLPPTVKHMGSLDIASASDEEKAQLRLKVSEAQADEEERIRKAREEMEEKGLGVIVNMRDFEVGRGVQANRSQLDTKGMRSRD